MSDDPYHRAVARHWMKKIDDYLHEDCAALTFAIAFRPTLLKKTPEQREARLAAVPNPLLRERQRLSVLQGIDSPHAMTAVRNYNKFIGEMEECLAYSPYLGGKSYSLADAAATPYINRAAMLAMDGLWISRRPHVTDWFERIRQRPSFAAAITTFVTDDYRQHFNIPREETWQKVRGVLVLD